MRIRTGRNFICEISEVVPNRSLFICINFGFTEIYYLTRAPLGGGGYFEPPSRFLAISSKTMQVSSPNLQYPLY